MIYVCAPQRGKPDIQKNKFYDELVCKWDMKDTKELTGDCRLYWLCWKNGG